MKMDLARRRFHFPDLGKGAQVIALMLIVGLLVAMAIQPTRQLVEQKQRISEMSADLQHVHNVNERLTDRIDRLKDPDYIEQRAREQVGLIRQDERTYVVIPPGTKGDGAPKKKKPERAAPAPVEDRGALGSFLEFIGVL